MITLTPARRTLLDRVYQKGPVFLKAREVKPALLLEKYGYISILDGLDMRLRPVKTASITKLGREAWSVQFEPRPGWEVLAVARGLIKGRKSGDDQR